MMLDENEKKLIIYLLKQHLKEVKETEKLPNIGIGFLAAEVKYEDFVKEIIDKLK